MFRVRDSTAATLSRGRGRARPMYRRWLPSRDPHRPQTWDFRFCKTSADVSLPPAGFCAEAPDRRREAHRPGDVQPVGEQRALHARGRHHHAPGDGVGAAAAGDRAGGNGGERERRQRSGVSGGGERL